MPQVALLVLLALLWMIASPGWTADDPGNESTTADTAERGGDPLGRDTPRGAMVGYFNAIDENDNERAARYLDLRNLPANIRSYTPEQLARGLSVVLQRGGWIDIESLSEDEEGHLADELPSYRDLVIRLETKRKPVNIYLQRVPGPDGSRIWKVSNATIAELGILYEEYRYNELVEWLSGKLPDVSFLGVELFKWVATLTLMVAVLPFLLLLGWWFARLLVKSDSELHVRVRRFFIGPATVVALLVIGNYCMERLGIGLEAQRVQQSQTLITLAIVWLLWQLINLLRDVWGQRLRKQGREASLALLKPLTTAVKILAVLLGLLVWLDNLGFEITAVLTGLGIGGIAVALVLQKPLEDVFGAVTLYTQQPIRIGDFGRFGRFTGTVEEINLRTTRIRTLDNSVVAVPNMLLANDAIENLSARKKFLYQPLLRLRNDSSAEQLQAVLKGVRAVLADHELVYDEGARARFTDIGTVSHNLGVFAYVNAQDWAGYLAVAEELNFAVLDVLAQANAQLAIPLDDIVRNNE
jgi:MscS family membrane protein